MVKEIVEQLYKPTVKEQKVLFLHTNTRKRDIDDDKEPPHTRGISFSPVRNVSELECVCQIGYTNCINDVRFPQPFRDISLQAS